MTDVPQAAVDAALRARDGSQSMTDEGLTRDMLAAAAPLIVTDALKVAAKKQFEAVIASAAEEATAARLREIEAVVRASERERWRAALTDALDGMEDMFGYVPEFFQEKWDHQGYIDRARAALAGPLTEEAAS